MGLLSLLYGLGLKCRKLVVKPQRLPAKVISVGNITLGGTGKTPAVIAIAEEARKRGLQTCILTRGYKGKVKGPCFVQSIEQSKDKISPNPSLTKRGTINPPFSKGGQRGDYIPHTCTGQDAGDEPALMAERLKDVPIVKCADRYKGGMYAISNLKSQISNLNSSLVTRHPSPVFILDDGFQHWALHRDVDILLIDATNPFGNEKLFPEGRLREPLSSMKRAQVIVLTKTDMAGKELLSALVRKIKRYNPEAPIYTATHKPAALINAERESAGLDNLKNKNIYAFAGIANPDYFKDVLISHGANMVKFKSFRDHHLYKQSDMDKIKTEAQELDIITTEKDLVKLRDLQLPEKLFALRIEFAIEDAFYDYIFELLFPLVGNLS
ncbi:MAG: tetraacyldisaccharide 4'-kinase [Nitrospirae bacterium]|nr:tetraacyldisaccharide 4'-kinase [Nitrospirota bacterium]